MRRRLASLLHWLTSGLAYDEPEQPVVDVDRETYPGLTRVTLDLEGNHVQAYWQTPKQKEQ